MTNSKLLNMWNGVRSLNTGVILPVHESFRRREQVFFGRKIVWSDLVVLLLRRRLDWLWQISQTNFSVVGRVKIQFWRKLFVFGGRRRVSDFLLALHQDE